MAVLKSLLPAPTHDFFHHPFQDGPLYPVDNFKQLKIDKPRPIPPYGQRQGWVPTAQDFEDGGSFPEIHVPQFPLNMGREDLAPSREVLTVTTDSEGSVNYSAIVTHARRKGEHVFAKPSDLRTKYFNDEQTERPSSDQERIVTERTRAVLEQKLSAKIKAAQPAAPLEKAGPPKYIRYTPANQNANFNSGSKHRIIRMVEAQQDPMEPPKFRARRAPSMAEDAPVPVMHSPERKPTPKLREAWKIPPCISNWKNNKGYTIPLDKRLAADGRGLQEVQINPNFAKLSESLYIAECAAREEVAKRNALSHQLALQEREENERTLKIIAERARIDRANFQHTRDPGESREEIEARRRRDELREERRREREREHRLENFMGKNKSKAARDQDRDISEKIALGMNVVPTQESQFDQRLFNQTQGLNSGFGDDEDYNVYSDPLFRRDDHNLIFKPPKKDEDTYGTMTMEDIINTSRFKPDKDFEGVDRSQKVEPRTGPVQFEKFLNDHSQQKVPKKISTRQTLGLMHATAGSSGKPEDYQNEGTRKRNWLDFEPVSKKPSEQKTDERENWRERHKEKIKEREREMKDQNNKEKDQNKDNSSRGDKDRNRENRDDRDRDRNRDRERDRRDRDRERERDRDRDRERERDRDRERERGRRRR